VLIYENSNPTVVEMKLNIDPNEKGCLKLLTALFK
jgi:hypothetical protein